ELMASSRLVFLRLNGEKTEGIDWEIDNLAKRGHLQKTIILSLDDDNRPLRFGSISRTLRPADVNNELANIPPLQSQQAIYHAGGGWHSIFTNDLKNPLGNLEVVLGRLRSEHPVLQSLSETERGRPSAAAFLRRRVNAGVATVSALLIVGGMVLQL